MKPPSKIVNENGGYLKQKHKIFILLKLGEADNCHPFRQQQAVAGKVSVFLHRQTILPWHGYLFP